MDHDTKPVQTEEEHGNGDHGEEDEEVWQDYVAVPPDGGWGWVVVFACFMSNMVVDGISYSFGILLPSMQQYYDTSQGQTALVGSLLCGVICLVGPIVGGLVNKFGSRLVMMTGAFLSMCAFLISAFSPTITILMLTYGVFGGIGFGFIYLPSIIHVSCYFDKKRALATGIAVAGSGAGTFIFSPLCVALQNYFSWKGALWVLAGLLFNCTVFGALLRPLKPKKDPRHFIEEIAENVGTTAYEDVEMFLSRASSIQSVDTSRKVPFRRTSELLSPNDAETDLQKMARLKAALAVVESESSVSPIEDGLDGSNLYLESGFEAGELEDEKNSPEHQNHKFEGHVSPRFTAKRMRTVSQNISSGTSTPAGVRRGSFQVFNRSQSRMSVKSYVNTLQRALSTQQTNEAANLANVDPEDFNRPLYRKDIFYSGSVLNIPDIAPGPSITDLYTGGSTAAADIAGISSYLESTISIPQMVLEDTVEHEPIEKLVTSICSCIPPPVRNALYEMIDIRLLEKPVMILLCVSNTVGMLGFYVPFVYLISKAEECGVHSGQAAFLLSLIGIANTVGRVFFGWFTDQGWVSALNINNACLLSCGFLTLCVPALTTFESMAVYAILFGSLISAYISLTSIILVDLLGLNALTNSFGLLMLARGVSIMMGSPLAGMVYDATQSYDNSFYFGGALITLSGAISCVIPLLNKVSCKKMSREKEQRPAKDNIKPWPGAVMLETLEEADEPPTNV